MQQDCCLLNIGKNLFYFDHKHDTCSLLIEVQKRDKIILHHAVKVSHYSLTLSIELNFEGEMFKDLTGTYTSTDTHMLFLV